MATLNSGLGGPAGYGENAMSVAGVDTGNLDDGSKLVDITSVFGPSGIDFYGSSYTSIYINTNGLITFAGPEVSFQPVGIAGYSNPAIAPFWSDVDINNGGEIYWDLDPTGGNVTITWLNVAPYSGSGANSFQIVLSNNGGGDFGVELIFGDIQWASVDYPNGGGGTTTFAATAGITDGGTNDFELEGSGNSTFMLSYENNDFDNGDPVGTFALNVSGGTVPCFAKGTRLETSRGEMAVEDIRPGDLILTLDHGLQPVLWVGSRSVSAVQMRGQPALRPVIIRKEALGNRRKLIVSQQHCMLVDGVFVRARHLANYCGGKIARIDRNCQSVEYFHILMPQHGVICAEGAWAESFFPGTMIVNGLGADQRLRLFSAAPELSKYDRREGSYGPPARPIARRSDIRANRPCLEHGILPKVHVGRLDATRDVERPYASTT